MPQNQEGQCPRCRLYNPPGAARCDCGYDFETATVQPSYALEHVLEKEGGTAAVLAKSARRSIVAGTCLLVLAGAMMILSTLANDRPRFPGLPMIMGVIFLVRGLRLRRRHTLDARLERELIRRA